MSEADRRRLGSRRLERLARRGGLIECLRLPATLFGALVRLRSGLYDRKLLPIRGVDTPVVCVGNLTVGGTGKTPMVARVVSLLQEEGLRPGILSRGYGRGREERNDEAALLARLARDVPHIQDADRVRGALALQEQGVDVIVLDDGFQHRRLARDLDIVLVDASRPFGLPPVDGRAVCALLPRGLLREPPRALARADLVVVTRSDAAGSSALCEELGRYGAPVLRAVHAPVSLRTLSGEELPLRRLTGIEVDLASGIAAPGAFERTITSLGARVHTHRIFPDHHRYEEGDLAGLGRDRPLVVTAKDEPKLSAECGAWVLDIELEITEGEELLRAALAALPPAQRRREREALHEGLHG